MMTGGAAKRYATAIFEIARDGNSFDVWQSDLDTMAQIVGDPHGREFFEFPKIDNSQKRQVVERLLSTRVQPAALNLARLLVERGRFPQVDRIAATLAELVRDHRGIAIAEVTTAVPLDPAAEADVARRLGAIVGRQQVDMQMHVDPSIIGGIIARVGDFLIDGSVTGQLRRLRARVAEGR